MLHPLANNLGTDVYYALSLYMMQTLDVPYPTEPKAQWSRTAIAGEEVQEPVDDLGGNDSEQNVVTTDEELTDEELYALPRFE